jgi:hypothetical protein
MLVILEPCLNELRFELSGLALLGYRAEGVVALAERIFLGFSYGSERGRRRTWRWARPRPVSHVVETVQTPQCLWCCPEHSY